MRACGVVVGGSGLGVSGGGGGGGGCGCGGEGGGGGGGEGLCFAAWVDEAAWEAYLATP